MYPAHSSPPSFARNFLPLADRPITWRLQLASVRDSSPPILAARKIPGSRWPPYRRTEPPRLWTLKIPLPTTELTGHASQRDLLLAASKVDPASTRRKSRGAPALVGVDIGKNLSGKIFLASARGQKSSAKKNGSCASCARRFSAYQDTRTSRLVSIEQEQIRRWKYAR